MWEMVLIFIRIQHKEADMKKTVTMVALVLFVLALIIPTAVFAADKPKFAIVFKNTGNPYGEKQLEGFRIGIEEQGFEAILRSPDLPTAEAQIQII